MKECTANKAAITTHSSVDALRPAKDQNPVKHYGAFVGLDVHKQTIAVAVAEPGRLPGEYVKEIANQPKSVEKLVRSLSERFAGEVLLFCYEAGPCGYPLYHQLVALGHDCQVVAPSQIPKKSGDRIKTDRRDAIKLAQFLRSGDLTPVWVPNEEQEAMRDLTRARSDMKAQERKAKQQLGAFVLRHGRHWPSNRTRRRALRPDHSSRQGARPHEGGRARHRKSLLVLDRRSIDQSRYIDNQHRNRRHQDKIETSPRCRPSRAVECWT